MTVGSTVQVSDLEFDHGFFDSAAFARAALAGWQQLAAVVDSALLAPHATRAEIEKLCEQAARYRFACVVVNPVWTAVAVKLLSGSGVAVGSVVGFPLGASLVSTLCQEAAALLRLGVRELNLVIPIGQLKSGNHHAVENDVRAVVHVARHHGATVKAILETGLLSVEENLRAAEVSIQAGADFIQTATGFSSSGANPSDVALLRGVAGSRSGVSASGGVRTLADVRALLEAGASRIGTQAAVEIVRELGAE